MRILLAVIILAALGWSGYWFIGARAVENGIAGWIEERADAGWVVAAEDVSTTGFPNRFDTTITSLELADPDTGWAWQAPFFQILSLSYKPNHVITVWPDQQVLATPNEKMTITSEEMRASFVFQPGTDYAFDRATLQFANIGVVSTGGLRTSLARGQLALRQTPMRENSYDLAFSAQDLMVPSQVARLLSQHATISETLQRLNLEATVLFDTQWDRRAIEEERPQPLEIRIKTAQLQWGELDLRLAGRVEIDAQGRPDGEITIKATNWREILQLAKAAQALPESVLSLIESGLTTLARLSGNPRSLDVPVSFNKGQMVLGGLLPIGQAPRLVLR